MDSTQLPVTEIVVHRNGVGYFTHAGEINGAADVRLTVDAEAIDDVLGSLVVDDPQGSAPQVSFPAADPLERVLASLALDLTGGAGALDVLQRARGERVRVESGETMEGRLLGVDAVTDPRGPAKNFLTVATPGGLRRVELGEIRTLRFLDETVQADLDRALAAIATDRRGDGREVTVRLRGEGRRRVSLAYVRPMPVWKTAYRLNLGDDGRADLQGWAIVDNPTDLDLTDVTVSVVAGEPMSFITTLATPRYVDRPRVGPAVTESVVPEAYAFGYEDATEARGGGYAPMAMPAAAPRMAMAAAPAVEPQAEAQESGLDVAYVIREPVTIPRYSSAMIPIIQQRLDATRLSVFDSAVDDEHPMRGLLLRNDSGLRLAAGPVTVLDGGYAGTATLEDLMPGGDQIITYARDRAVTVEHEHERPERSQQVRLVGGMVRSTTTRRSPVTLRLTSEAATDRVVLVMVPAPSDSEVVGVDPAPPRLAGTYRFGVLLRGRDGGGDTARGLAVQVEAGVGERAVLGFALQHVEHRDAYAHASDESVLRLCLTGREVSPAERELLERLAELARRGSELSRERGDLERRRETIAEDQERIRGNLGAIDHSAQLYQRYLADLGAQEDELAAMRRRLGELKAERATLRARAVAASEELSRES